MCYRWIWTCWIALAIVFADKGKKVMSLDINENVMNIIKNGKMPFI